MDNSNSKSLDPISNDIIPEGLESTDEEVKTQNCVGDLVTQLDNLSIDNEQVDIKEDIQDKNNHNEAKESEIEDKELTVDKNKSQVEDKLDPAQETKVEKLEQQQKPKKQIIRKGRGFKESSQGVLREDESHEAETVNETEKEKVKPTRSTPNKERNTAVASRMIRFALGVNSPLSKREKEQEERLKEARESRQKDSKG